MPSLFITGTDTSVGKTVVTRAIIQTLAEHNFPVVGYKPIACGSNDSQPTEPNQHDHVTEDNADVLTILDSCQIDISYKDINSYTFIHSSTPIFAALDTVQHIQIEKLNTTLKQLERSHQNVVVEGTYGWLTPINKDFSFADWVKQNSMPVIIVVGIKEGCVNHALLTASEVLQRGVKLIGWVANRINPGLSHYLELIKLLSQKIKAPLLGQLPYMGHPEQKRLSPYIQNPEPLFEYFKTK